MQLAEALLGLGLVQVDREFVSRGVIIVGRVRERSDIEDHERLQDSAHLTEGCETRLVEDTRSQVIVEIVAQVL
jgi:hypothetical protein